MCGQVQILIISNYFHSIRTLLFGKFWMMTSFSLRCSRELMANHIPSVMFYIKLESPYTVIQVGVCVHVCAAHYLVFIFIMVTVYISIIFRFIVYSIIYISRHRQHLLCFTFDWLSGRQSYFIFLYHSHT